MNNDKSSLGVDQSIARRHNRSQILNRLRIQGSVSRADLAKQTGLTRSTISRIVDELINEKLIREFALSQNGRGRPGIMLSLNPQGGAAIGMEIGVHFISIMLTDFSPNLIWKKRITLDEGCELTTYIQKAEALVHYAFSLAKQYGIPLMGIGIAVWGLVNHINNRIIFAPNLGWRDIHLADKWKELFHVPIYVENDANASALGEYYFGAGKKFEDLIYMSMDIGIGSGIISKGQLFFGASGYAGEIGHVMIDPEGTVCSCGRRGCLETKAGRHVIEKKYQELTGSKPLSLEEIIKRGKGDDLIAKDIFYEVGESLGIGISHLINLFNPQCVILGWSLGQAFDLLMPGIERSLVNASMPELRSNLVLLPSLNGSDDALYGSIALVLDEVIRESESHYSLFRS